jgi:hypothetical protein
VACVSPAIRARCRRVATYASFRARHAGTRPVVFFFVLLFVLFLSYRSSVAVARGAPVSISCHPLQRPLHTDASPLGFMGLQWVLVRSFHFLAARQCCAVSLVFLSQVAGGSVAVGSPDDGEGGGAGWCLVACVSTAVPVRYAAVHVPHPLAITTPPGSPTAALSPPHSPLPP